MQPLRRPGPYRRQIRAVRPLFPRRGPPGGPTSAEPWREFILAKHAQGLSAKRIHQDLRGRAWREVISYDSVRRLLKRLGALRPLPLRRMECEPGQEAQIDFGTGARITDARRQAAQDARAARGALTFAEGVIAKPAFRQTAEDFLRVLENAFWHFGGVPKTVVVDNLKAAVLRPIGSIPS